MLRSLLPEDRVTRLSAAHDQPFQVVLTLEEGYRMSADFGLGTAPLVLDEPVPLGSGGGPNAARVLATAVGHCLAASLLFCLKKSRVDVQRMTATVDGTFQRNERGRLRIASLRVHLNPTVPPDQRTRMQRCLDVFEDYCIVSQSVGQGISIETLVDTVPAQDVPAQTS